MDALTFLRDLGRDVPPPAAADLAPARDHLMAEIAEAPAHLPASRPERDGRRAEGLAPVTDLEPRATRGRRVAAIALAAAAAAAVAGAAVGGVALLRELAPDERSTGPVPTAEPDPTQPPIVSDAPYVRLERVVEHRNPWDEDTGGAAETWADAESAVVTSATVSLSVPGDPRGAEEWVWRYADDCALIGVYGAQVDPEPALLLCRQRDLGAPGVEHRAVWADIATGEAARGEDGEHIPLELVDGGHGVWAELPRDPAALLEWYESRADTFERSWLGVMTEALALNQMPDDLAAAMLEAVALVPGAEVERDAQGGISRLAVGEQLGGDASQRTILTVDAATRLVGLTEERSYGGDPGQLGEQLPGGGAWTVRTTITATPAEAPEAPAEQTPDQGPEQETPQDTAPPAARAPAVDDLVVSTDGLGPIAMGEPLADVALQMAAPSSEGCRTTYIRTADPYWRDDGGYLRTGGPAFLVSAGQVVDRIDVVSPVIRTPSGIRVGSSLAEVEAAYPGVAGIDAGFSTLYAIAGARGTVVVEVANGDTGYWGDAALTVAFIRVIPPGAEPTAIAASDDTIGSCRDGL